MSFLPGSSRRLVLQLLKGKIGAAVGGAGGLLAGLGAFAIPGIGPVVGAGWLVATLVGAAAGGVAGGLLGMLTDASTSVTPIFTRRGCVEVDHWSAPVWMTDRSMQPLPYCRSQVRSISGIAGMNTKPAGGRRSTRAPDPGTLRTATHGPPSFPLRHVNLEGNNTSAAWDEAHMDDRFALYGRTLASLKNSWGGLADVVQAVERT